MQRLFALLLATCVSLSCNARADEKMYLQRVEYSDISGWGSDNHVDALDTFLRSCSDFDLHPDGEAIGKEQFLAPAIVWKRVCQKAYLITASDEPGARHFFEQEFVPVKLTSDKNEHATLTGYYEPLLNGSRTKERPYVYPVYAQPALPVNFTRAKIDALGYLGGVAPVIAYVDDPVKLFFMHVQGSGIIKTSCGENIHVGYAGNNGQSYVSIGKVMVDKGLIDKKDVSMQTISEWLYAHPDQMWDIMWHNPSYIFFHEMDGGPYGTERVRLTSNRSLAVDSNYIPLGMPVFVNSAVPKIGGAPYTLFHKLMVAQDTGHAIIGPMRGDIYFGTGIDSEQLAGRMNAGGDFTLLMPQELYNKMR